MNINTQLNSLHADQFNNAYYSNNVRATTTPIPSLGGDGERSLTNESVKNLWKRKMENS